MAVEASLQKIEIQYEIGRKLWFIMPTKDRGEGQRTYESGLQEGGGEGNPGSWKNMPRTMTMWQWNQFRKRAIILNPEGQGDGSTGKAPVVQTWQLQNKAPTIVSSKFSKIGLLSFSQCIFWRQQGGGCYCFFLPISPLSLDHQTL